MGKRIVFDCDWCKNDFDEADSSKIHIAKPGKKSNNKWDLCPGCAEEIQSRLIATEVPRQKQKHTRRGEDRPEDEEYLAEQADLDERIRKARIARGEADQDDNDVLDAFIERDRNVAIAGGPALKEMTDEQSDCSHANRSSIFSAQYKGDNRPRMYTRCSHCELVIPYKTALQKKVRSQAKIGKNDDVRVGHNAAMKRKENRIGRGTTTKKKVSRRK